jgi:hypothetical protein
MGGCGRCGRMAPAAVLLALTALAGSAKADIIDAFVQVNVYYGVAQLYSPADVLLSTTVAMTVETQAGYAGQASLTSFLMPLMDQAVEQQLPGISPALPTYILSNLASFANSTGFGTPVDLATSVYPPDPNNFPSASAAALYQTLTTQPVPFTVTSDTGFVLLGADFDYVVDYGPFGPVPGTAGDTVEGATNVEAFERDIRLQETPVPEPGSLGLLGVVVGLILWKHLRT